MHKAFGQVNKRLKTMLIKNVLNIEHIYTQC